MEITEDFIRECGQSHDLGNTWIKALDALKISLGWSISPPKSTQFIINWFAQEFVKRCKILLLWKKLRTAWPQRPFHWTKHSIQVGPIFSSGQSSVEYRPGKCQITYFLLVFLVFFPWSTEMLFSVCIMWNSAAVNSCTGEKGVVWCWLSSFSCFLLETHYKSDGLNQQSIVDHFHMIVTFLEPQTNPSYVESAYKQS